MINLITLIDHLIENEPDVAAFGMNVKKSYTLTNTYYYKSIYLFLFKPYFLKVETSYNVYFLLTVHDRSPYYAYLAVDFVYFCRETHSKGA